MLLCNHLERNWVLGSVEGSINISLGYQAIVLIGFKSTEASGERWRFSGFLQG